MQRRLFCGKLTASRSRHYSSIERVIIVPSLSSRTEQEEEKSAINLQEGGRRYCLSSRAQTCWGHPVRPLLFLSPADEEDDDEDEDDEVVLGISTCRHMTFIVIYLMHIDTCALF